MKTLASTTAALALVALPAAAGAADCTTLPSAIYGIGGSAQKPLIARVATALAAAIPARTVVYQAPGACVGINALISDTKLTGNASYWGVDGKEQQCTLPVAGLSANFALMGNSASLCPGVGTLPGGIGAFLGPVSAVNFVVPIGSSQQSISAEAAYFVYGFGKPGRATPWIDEASIIRRDENSYVSLFVSLATGVPPTVFKGVDAKTNANTVTLVATAANPESAIGYVSSDVADANRATVRALAYQHTGQTCGYWPDSTPTSFDKANVRSGQYYLWSPVQFFAPLDQNGKIADAGTRDFIGLFTGEVAPPPGVDMLALQSMSGNVPKCAMRAWRTSDLGPLMSYQPPEPCGCYFDKVATGTTACTPCVTSADCSSSSPVCRNSYCEVK
jgi:ABC-type phosphate transport system substrate-binding protein